MGNVEIEIEANISETGEELVTATITGDTSWHIRDDGKRIEYIKDWWVAGVDGDRVKINEHDHPHLCGKFQSWLINNNYENAIMDALEYELGESE